MKMRFAIAAATLFAGLSGPALADARTDSCTFANMLAKQGVAPAIDFLETLASGWAAEDRSKLASIMGAELDRFAFKGTQVYQIAAIPGAVEEYFAVMYLRDAGSVYLRLLFEGNGGALSFINIDFKASYYDAIASPFFSTPVAVTCEPQSSRK